jgi:Asp-tRNA(Asn)/Glu-tRNA(Gln) amidotransferase C subunit
MNNSYDEIKKLLEASNKMLKGNSLNEDITHIRKSYGIISEQDITQKEDPTMSSINQSNDMDNEETPQKSNEKNSKEDKQQSYRVSGGVITLHGKENTDLELTTDEKMAFQETMDEFVNEVSDLVDFETLNVYKTDVEWGGKIIDFDIEFYFTIGENNGIYINGTMIKIDEDFTEMITKLQTYYEKFKTKWAKVMASRKKTSPRPE